MTRDDAQAIIDNIETVRWFAEGGQLEYDHSSESDGKKKWQLHDDNRMLIKSIARYRPAKGCVCNTCELKDCLQRTRRRS